jgi:hypothetical protein
MPDRGAERDAGLVQSRAIGALLQVRLEVARVLRLELAINVGIELQLELVVRHLRLPSHSGIMPLATAGALATAAT